MNTRNTSNTDHSQGAVAARVEADAKGALSSAKKDIAGLGDEASAIASEAKHQAGKAMEHVSHEALNFVDEQKAALCGRIDRVAEATRKVAKELEGEDAATARTAKAIASSIGGIGSTLRDKDVDELVSMATDFGRRQPATFMAAAALAGFAASRFLKASAARRHETRKPESSERSAAARDGHSPSLPITSGEMEGRAR